MFKRFIAIIACLFLSGFGCSTCSPHSDTPNIRTISGIEQCPAMCEHLTAMHCDDYTQPVYMPLSDGGIQTLDCTAFCQYEMSNSIDFKPDCVINTKNCGEVMSNCGF